MYNFKSLTIEQTEKVKEFADIWIGKDYFSNEELVEICELSTCDELNASIVAYQDNIIVGMRLTLAPGCFPKLRGITPSAWKVPKQQVGYFKSLFIHGNHQGNGLGKELSNASIVILEKMGAKAIVCHSWLESPNNSSQRYLAKMGFELVKEHPRFWFEIDYDCVRCAPSRCICTAGEMIRYL